MVTIPDFDRMYEHDPDPWRVATSWYERRKIDVVMSCLRRDRYRLAWDAACGTGELTAALADRSDAVIASDASPRACDLTGARCRGLPNVHVECSALPEVPVALGRIAGPGIGPDLVVLSEFLYYLDDEQRALSGDRVAQVAAPGADIVAVHWSPQPDDARESGVHVQRELDEALLTRGWSRLVAHRDIEFMLTLWSTDVPSHIGR